jgi:hypothetical protein
MARRSATESAAILDACRLLSLIDTDKSSKDVSRCCESSRCSPRWS